MERVAEMFTLQVAQFPWDESCHGGCQVAENTCFNKPVYTTFKSSIINI